MFLDKYAKQYDAATLILRIGFGLAFIHHGWDKFFGGPALWQPYGQLVLKYIGLGDVELLTTIFGFLAGASEFLGGLFLILGLLTPYAALFMGLTMLGALIHHIGSGDAIGRMLHPAEALVVFISLILFGPGRYSLDAKRNNQPSTEPAST